MTKVCRPLPSRSRQFPSGAAAYPANTVQVRKSRTTFGIGRRCGRYDHEWPGERGSRAAPAVGFDVAPTLAESEAREGRARVLTGTKDALGPAFAVVPGHTPARSRNRQVLRELCHDHPTLVHHRAPRWQPSLGFGYQNRHSNRGRKEVSDNRSPCNVLATINRRPSGPELHFRIPRNPGSDRAGRIAAHTPG